MATQDNKQAKYKRVLLKVSGEALAGAQKTGLNSDVLGAISEKWYGCDITIVR